jgi:uncharacterized membrane protein
MTAMSKPNKEQHRRSIRLALALGGLVILVMLLTVWSLMRNLGN